MKIGTILCIILVMCTADSIRPLAGYSLWVNILFVGVVIAVLKLLFGGWSASTVKGMVWSVILSTIGSLVLVLIGMKAGGESISYFMLFLPSIIAAILGIAAGKWIQDLITIEMGESLGLETVADSVVNNGLRSTVGDFMDIVDGGIYYSASRGVAVYSNIAIIIGLILNIYYR